MRVGKEAAWWETVFVCLFVSMAGMHGVKAFARMVREPHHDTLFLRKDGAKRLAQRLYTCRNFTIFKEK
jgi:hypothetical protein